MSDSDADDVHYCLRCKGTFIGLDVYIEHRKVRCKRDDVGPSLQFPKADDPIDKGNAQSGSEQCNRASWTSSPSVKDDSRLEDDSRMEDDLQTDIIDINRKDDMLDTFLPSNDNDSCLKAVDFFSFLELQSSKSFHELPAQKSQSGMITRSKYSAVLQAERNRDFPFGIKPFTSDYPYDLYSGEHSRYVVGKDVIITDNSDYRKEEIGSYKEKKTPGLSSPKSKSRSEDKLIEDDRKSDTGNQILFQEVHNEVTISCEGNAPEESDSFSDGSDEEDEYNDYDNRRISSGGKWKPVNSEWETSTYWGSTPPASHTGGKWKPSSPSIIASTSVSLLPTQSTSSPSSSLASTSVSLQPTQSTSREEILSEPQSPLSSNSREPPLNYTRGKWLPTTDPSAKTKFWCGPCNRRLSSQTLYEKHCQSDLHRRRTYQETQLEEDLLLDQPRVSGKREIKRTQSYIQSDLWRKSKRRRSHARECKVTSLAEERRGRGAILCSVCQCRVWPHLIGKHLVSRFHCRRARSCPELASELVLRYMPSVVRQAPFQCGSCRFFCNTMSAFLQHWTDETHNHKDSQAEGRYCCSFCRVECSSSSTMYQHLLSNQHKDSVAIINGSVPILIQKKRILQCEVCEKQFNYNVELRRHARISDHPQSSGPGSDKYQQREACERCDFVAFSKISIQRHQAQAHRDAEGRFFCTCCDATFPTAADAKTHRASAEHRRAGGQESAKVCNHCYSVFAGVTDLKRHLKCEHPDMTYRCIKCGVHFTLKQELARHVRVGCSGIEEQSSTSPGLLRCSKCHFSSDSEAEILYHTALQHDESLGDGRYRCPSCPRAFLKSSLRKHLLSHTGERPYSCKVCGAGFTRKDVLDNHLLGVHSLQRVAADSWESRPDRKRTETCAECGASFYDKNSLAQHRQIHEGKQFKCEVEGCVYAGRSKGELRHHLLTHASARPFRCDICHFAAKTKAQLVRHARSHSELRTHQCDHCDFTCNSATHLKRHRRLHTGAKPFHCPHCDFSCNLLENLRKHVLSTKKHPGKGMYSCRHPECSFCTNLAKDFRVHLVTVHSQTASAAASFVAGLYQGDEDPRHVDQPLPAPHPRKKRKQTKKFIAEDVILESNPKTLTHNPTLSSAAIPGTSGDLLQPVVIAEHADDVICIELPAEDGLDGYDSASFFSHGDSFSDMSQRTLFDGLHRRSLMESAVILPEDIEEHEDLIVVEAEVQAHQ